MTSTQTVTPQEPVDDPSARLQALREELDRIDAALLVTIRDRLACCGRIGHHKKLNGVPMMQLGRIGVVQDRAALFAQQHCMSGEFLRQLYDLIIAEACRLEDEIIQPVGSQSA